MSKRAPYPVRESAEGSPSYWRSLEERAAPSEPGQGGPNAPEFPKGHLDTPPSDEAWHFSRRGLLGAMAATFALVGSEGCRRPIERIVPYTKMPEDVVPGVPTHYTTVIQRRGEALGLVVESHEGRPTKIEGNDGQPSSSGAADLVAQASILDLYDPERSTTPRKSGSASSWDDFEKELAARLATFERDEGARLRVLMPPTLSPTVLRMRALLAQRFAKARVHTWSAVADSNIREGARIAFGQPVTPLYAYDRAHVILSLDSDFLQTESGNVRATRQFSAGRLLRSSKDKDATKDPMTRLYVVEPSPTTTGANADHRLRLPATDVERYTYALAVELEKQGVVLSADLEPSVRKQANADDIPPQWLSAVAKDLAANRRNAVIVVGSRQPPRLHALVHALNLALGAFDSVVHFVPVTDPDELDAASDVKALADAIDAGKVDALIILGGNPVYDAPADVALGEKLGKVPLTVHASLHFDETSEKCTWHVPRAHCFESWGDARSLDGTVSVQQPLIAPLYGGRSDIELLALMANAPEKTGYDAVRTTVLAEVLEAHQLECGPFVGTNAACHDAHGKSLSLGQWAVDREWHRALSSGLLTRAKPPSKADAVRFADVAGAIDRRVAPPRVGPEALEITFAPCPKMVDGSEANNTWLQETPDPVTKLVWDNAALVSPATAKALGLAKKDVVRIALGDRSITAGVWIVPGQAEHSVGLTLGWGRRKAGRIGNLRGFDVYPLRTASALGFAVGARVSKSGDDPYFFAQTQEHDSTESRPIAHETTLAEYRVKPNFAQLDTPPQRALPLWSQADYSKGHQWGMSIDLNACTGCAACVVACMAENNVPVVGKTEIWRGRQMHWLRIDRYWVEDPKLGATAADPLVVNEPVMCMHCEEAPCENVCPVNATTHGPEGLNEMAYNRCIGTRYCANNCPYKVRRFNYLNWHNDSVWKATGGLPETLQMQHNPNVTVRFRGVMEKCTYCVQRIQSAKIRAKRELRELRDGEIKTACQQTCPADAIVFGDVNDPRSKVTTASRTDRRFGLLAEVGTRPRTTYLGKIRNPNPEMI
ncbi:MAG TPA: Fe-S-cluster-containing hydrogenase [Polyangiaceae bacterium]|nr:Fe-S-cluster-containing hydrogenase [Polyangiaceae bacterium]